MSKQPFKPRSETGVIRADGDFMFHNNKIQLCSSFIRLFGGLTPGRYTIRAQSTPFEGSKRIVLVKHKNSFYYRAVLLPSIIGLVYHTLHDYIGFEPISDATFDIERRRTLYVSFTPLPTNEPK